MDKNKRAALLRKLFVGAALIVLLGLLFAFYFLAYIPRQQDNYNKRTFRILHEISGNFDSSIENLEAVTRNNNNNKKATYNSIKLEEKDRAIKLESLRDTTLKKIAGEPNNKSDTFHAEFIEDMVYFTATDTSKKPKSVAPKETSEAMGMLTDTSLKRKPVAPRSVKNIIEPIINIHNDIFDALILVTDTVNKPATGKIIYKTNEINIDPAINVDSIIKKTAFTAPCIKDVNIEAVNYKLFIFPFRIHAQQFLLGGFITAKNYKSTSQKFPLHPLAYAGVLLLIILCSLPFLKVFLLAPQENITIRDVRAIVCVTYMIPFFFILLLLGFWLYKGADKRSTESLRILHKNVTDNFYKEIKDCITQLKMYDALVNKELKNNDTLREFINTSIKEHADFKDLFFYPRYYKNLDGIAWVDQRGFDIAKWNFIDSPPPFLNKSDRDFVDQIRLNKGFMFDGSDTFSIQPTLSRAIGEYNINIAIHKDTAKEIKKAILINMAARMYSVMDPVTPAGENFCIIDEDGNILYHSETDRALHENIFKEADNTLALRTALTHKDSILLHSVNIYDRNVKMLITPLKDLPYYIIVYYDKRLDRLFLGHIMLFSFFCACLLLLLVTIITLFFYYTRKKNKILFASDEGIGFSKPAPSKEQFFIHITAYCFIVIVLFVVASLLFHFRKDEWLYFVLNFSFLSPFFSLFGYYILNLFDSVKRKKDKGKTRRHPSYLGATILNIIVVYTIVIAVFYVVKYNIANEAFSTSKIIAEIVLIVFEIVCPALAVCIGHFGIPFGTVKKIAYKIKNLQERYFKIMPVNFFFRRIVYLMKNKQKRYLTYFLIAILLSVVLTSVLPAIGLIVNASNQEKILALKSQQIALAEDIQQRRVKLNKKLAGVKINKISPHLFRQEDSLYIDSLKFNPAKGLYLQYNTLKTCKNWGNDSDNYTNSFFYKNITQFLRLPSDHIHYYSNAKDYYYWKKKDNTNDLKLYYHNITDNKDASNFILTTILAPPLTFFSIFEKRLSLYCIIAIAIFFICFYKLLLSTTKKIFLVGYFESANVLQQDALFLHNFFDDFTVLAPFEREFWGKRKIYIKNVAEKENITSTSPIAEQQNILKIQTLLTPVYDAIWNKLSPEEQFVIYDFATDSFTNYKNVDILYMLYKKGLLIKHDHNLGLFNRSFGNYLLDKKDSKPIEKLRKEVTGGGTWGNFRTIFYVLLFAGIIFLFVVQEDTSKKLIAIFTALATLVPLMIKLFDSGSSPTNESVKK